MRYNFSMIKTFADKQTAALFITGRSKRFQPDILKRAMRHLEYIDLASCLDDLRVPPSNNLHAFKGDRKDRYAIAINDQWRICFKFIDGDAFDVEITDYH
jgi:Plasmid maintenance system killer protein